MNFQYRIIYGFFILCILTFFYGCSNIGYYIQAAKGHIEIMANRESIPDLANHKGTNDKLKEQLNLVLRIRKFAVSELKLPDNNSYTTYVDLKRPYVVWSIFATPKLSIVPKKWCYPIIGCVSYKGFFLERDALFLSEILENQGYDVFISGTAAYSTLGWFDDPVLNTFINSGEAALSGLIFHELAHQLLYIKDDSDFNEAFATIVEEEGVRRWMELENNKNIRENYLCRHIRYRQFVELILKYRKRLGITFSEHLTTEEKLIEKKKIYKNLSDEYQILKNLQWSGYSGYDNWMTFKLNNAKLSTISTYNNLFFAFLSLLKSVDYDLPKFYKKCRNISEKSFNERRDWLKRYERTPNKL